MKMFNGEELSRKEINSCLEMIESNVYTLMYFSKEQKNNKEIILAAVKKDGENLYYASDALKNDREVVLEAVTKTGAALRHASEEFRDDKDVVLKAIEERGLYSVFRYASDNLKADKDTVLKAIDVYVFDLKYASLELQDDYDLLKLLKQKDVLNHVNNGDKKWYGERMQKLRELEILEEDKWMRENNPASIKTVRAKKF